MVGEREGELEVGREGGAHGLKGPLQALIAGVVAVVFDIAHFAEGVGPRAKHPRQPEAATTSGVEDEAPFDALVIQGDLTQQVGSPVKQGQVLFRLAPLGDYRVILKVDERDVLLVRDSERGSLVLAGETSQKLKFTVYNIAGAEAANGLNYFRVEARIDGDAAALRPGMEGVGKIVTGEAPLLKSWTRRARQWLHSTGFAGGHDPRQAASAADFVQVG